MTPVRQMKDKQKFDERGWFGRTFDRLTKGAGLALAFPPFFLLREHMIWGASETCSQPCGDEQKDESQLGTNGREEKQDQGAWWHPKHRGYSNCLPLDFWLFGGKEMSVYLRNCRIFCFLERNTFPVKTSSRGVSNEDTGSYFPTEMS